MGHRSATDPPRTGPVAANGARVAATLALAGLLAIAFAAAPTGAAAGPVAGHAGSDGVLPAGLEAVPSLGTGANPPVGSVARFQDEDDPGDATAERDGTDLVLSVPADRIDAEGPVALSVEVPHANASTTATAEPAADRYVAWVPVTELVEAGVGTDRSASTVRASRGGTVVLEAEADLRYVAADGRPAFAGTTLELPVDARGVGDASVELRIADGNHTIAAEVAGDGAVSGASLVVSPEELRGLPAAATHRATVLVDGEPVPGEALRFGIADAAGRASALAYRGDRLVVRQPLLHPAIGPAVVDLRIDTAGPTGTYLVRGANTSGELPVPGELAGASVHRLTVEANGSTILDGVRLGAPSRPTVPLRIENGTLLAPEPDALEGYDAVVLGGADSVHHVPIGESLRAGDPQPLPAELVDEVGGEFAGATGPPGGRVDAILVGADARPARVDLTVVEPEVPEVESGPAPPDADAFVGLWLDVGAGVVLLGLAMVGAFGAVGAAFAVRVASPARSAAAGGTAVAGHFLLGGAGGIAAIAGVQAAWTGPVVGSVSVAGLEVGVGALLVGSFHGGLTAVGLRVGLGTAGAWPTRRIVGRTAPVLVRVADDAGEPVPGGPTVAVQRARSASVLTTATVSGTTAELALPPGEYRVIARTGERETDPAEVTVDESGTTLDEPTEVHLTVARPSLEVVVVDADTGRPVHDASATVTTDRGETRSLAVADGSARVALPIATGTVTVVVDAERYERTTVETPIDEQLTTLDVDLPPATGTLVATALVDGDPLPGAHVRVEPAEDDPPAVGERTADLETGEDGTVATDLPVGRYRLRLDLEGPNADRFEVAAATATLEPDARAVVAVRARFAWSLPTGVRQRAGRIQGTIRSVGAEATADPTIPLYFAAVSEALLGILAALPESGPLFVHSALDPDDVAAATVDAAGATLQAVGRAMQADGVGPVLAAGDEPEHVRPDLAASPAALLDHLGRDVTVATVETRANRVRERVDEEADRLVTVAPARAVAGVALRLPRDADRPIAVATREYAAVLLLDAVEQCFDRPPIRHRLSGARRPSEGADARGTPDGEDEGAVEEAG